MEFISNRDIVVRSLHGHAIQFRKGIPTSVPRVMHTECLEKGILPVDAGDTVDLVQEPSAPNLPPEDGDIRADRILEVITSIVKRNNSSDFTGGGHPSATSVSAALGWKVDQKEVGQVWVKNREELTRGADAKPKE